MATRTLSYKIPFIGKNGFAGGLCTENAIALDRNQMVRADNVLIGTALTRRKRGGMEDYFQDSVVRTLPADDLPIRGIIEFWRTAGLGGNPTADLFMHQDDKLISVDARNTDGVDRTGALTISPVGVPCYQAFNQILYFTSTVTADGYNKWTGSGNATAATDPADGPGKYILSHLGRMVMLGNNDFPFRVYLSSAYDPEDWTSVAPSDSTSLDLDDDGDPQGITGGVSFQGRLYIFTRRSTYEITGTTPATFVVTRVSSGIGCIAHSTIAKVPNDVIFASDRGVHSLRQLNAGRQTETTFISRDIQRLWTDLLNATRFAQFKAEYDENVNCYVLSIVAGSEVVNSDLLVYNIEFGTWMTWKGINARSLCTSFLNNKRYLLVGREDGTTAYLGVTSRLDFGEQFAERWQTGIIYPNQDPSIEHKFIGITIFASTTAQATIGISWNIDGQRDGTRVISLSAGEDLLGTSFVLGQSVLGIGQYLPYQVDISQVGHGIQLDFTVQSEGDVEIYGFILEVEDANPVYGSRSAIS